MKKKNSLNCPMAVKMIEWMNKWMSKWRNDWRNNNENKEYSILNMHDNKTAECYSGF